VDQIQLALERATYDFNNQKDHQQAIASHRPLDKYSQDVQHSTIISNLSNDFIDKADEILRDFNIHDTLSRELYQHRQTQTMEDDDLNWFKDFSQMEQWTSDEVTRLNQFQQYTSDPFIQTVNTAVKVMIRFSSKLKYRAWARKEERMIHATMINKTGTLTNILLPKAQALPEAHPYIKDPVTGQLRRCRNVREFQQATSGHHGQWMGPEKAKENSHFVKLKFDKDKQYRGATIDWQSPLPDDKRIKDQIPKIDEAPPDTKDKYRQAIDRMRCFFKVPEKSNPIFDYPFWFDPRTKEFSDTNVEKRFWKSAMSIPGKQRHDGFQLAIFGRLPQQWGQTMLNVYKSH